MSFHISEVFAGRWGMRWSSAVGQRSKFRTSGLLSSQRATQYFSCFSILYNWQSWHMVHFLSPSSLNSELVIWLWILLGCLLGLGFFVWGLCCFFFFLSFIRGFVFYFTSNLVSDTILPNLIERGSYFKCTFQEFWPRSHIWLEAETSRTRVSAFPSHDLPLLI